MSLSDTSISRLPIVKNGDLLHVTSKMTLFCRAALKDDIDNSRAAIVGVLQEVLPGDVLLVVDAMMTTNFNCYAECVVTNRNLRGTISVNALPSYTDADGFDFVVIPFEMMSQ